jgi:hypothetical protein
MVQREGEQKGEGRYLGSSRKQLVTFAYAVPDGVATKPGGANRSTKIIKQVEQIKTVDVNKTTKL